MENKNQVKAEKYCQSCSMPLIWKKAGSVQGTEKDGSKSTMYCKFCYEKGEFTQPNITIDEILSSGKKGIKASSEMNWFTKRMALMFFTKKNVSKLKRWNSKSK